MDFIKKYQSFIITGIVFAIISIFGSEGADYMQKALDSQKSVTEELAFATPYVVMGDVEKSEQWADTQEKKVASKVQTARRTVYTAFSVCDCETESPVLYKDQYKLPTPPDTDSTRAYVIDETSPAFVSTLVIQDGKVVGRPIYCNTNKDNCKLRLVRYIRQ